jgi:hypothetical protein
MTLKIIAAIMAVALVLAFIGPVVFKLKDIALTAVALIGAAMMLVDTWQSVRDSDD